MNHLGTRDQVDDLLGDDSLDRMCQRDRDAIRELPGDGGCDLGVAVPDVDRSQRGDQIDELVPVDIPDAAPFRSRPVQRRESGGKDLV